MVKNIEIAKSWFVLAQILAIISGLFAVSGGLFLFGLDDFLPMLKDVVAICEDVESISPGEYANKSECIDDTVKTLSESTLNSQFVAFLLFFLAISMGILSLGYWILGRIKLEQEEFPDKVFGALIFFVMIILNIIVYVVMKEALNILK
jgi:hypothetical protein